VGLPLTLLAILAVEAYFAAANEYLPTDPGYVVEATVSASTGGTDPTLNLVILGDSTVAGVGSPTSAESLAVLIAERVADQLDRSVHVLGLGMSGARTATVREKQAPLLREHNPDIVLIVVGSNDVTHLTSPWLLDNQTKALVEAVHKVADAPVVVGGIPQFRTVPALAQPLRWVVGRYASVLREVQRQAVAKTGATYVDIAAEASPRFLGKPESMSSDGYHPSPLGYSFWADALAPAITARVSRQSR